MNKWQINSRKNILPLSKDKSTLELAFEEWRYTGKCLSLEKVEACELCECDKLLSKFESSCGYASCDR